MIFRDNTVLTLFGVLGSHGEGENGTAMLEKEATVFIPVSLRFEGSRTNGFLYKYHGLYIRTIYILYPYGILNPILREEGLNVCIDLSY